MYALPFSVKRCEALSGDIKKKSSGQTHVTRLELAVCDDELVVCGCLDESGQGMISVNSTTVI